MNTRSTKFRLTALVVGALALLCLGIGLFSASIIRAALSDMFLEGGRNAVMLAAADARSRYRDFSAAQEGLNPRDGVAGSMRAHLNKIRLGESGFLFVVGDDGGLVIAPERFGLAPQADSVLNAALLKTIREAAAHPDAPSPVSLRDRSANSLKARPALLHAEYIEPLEWYLAGISFLDELDAPARRLSLFLIAGMIVAAAVLCAAALFVVGRITTPLTQLTTFARRLPETDFLRDREQEQDAVLARLADPVRQDEVGELSRALLFMDGALRDRVRDLVEATGARERMAGELLAATEIQQGFLPPPIDGERSKGRFRLAASLVPAREVGGDLYDFFMLDGERLCIVIGDVSDKGVPAALFMIMTMAFVRSAASGPDGSAGPDAIMRSVNENLARDNANGMFVTLFIAFLDAGTGLLTFANGGHNPPLLRSGGALRFLEDAAGPVAGAFADAEYARHSVAMLPGDQLFLYTDGLTEAMNAGGELFGEDALRAVVAGSGASDPDGVVQAVQSAVAAHVGGAPASDDLTMLCLAYKGLSSRAVRAASC